MRTATPLLLSVGIHIAAAALLIIALETDFPSDAMRTETIRLKIVTDFPQPIPAIAPNPIPKPILAQTKSPVTQKPQTIAVPIPLTPALVAAKPVQNVIQPVQPVHPVSVASSPIAAAKTAEPEAVPPKASVPPPSPPINIQKVYEEENLGKIRTLLAQNLVYPKNARRLNQQGDILVTFTLHPSGEVSHIVIAESSSFDLLDEAALRLIEQSAPQFPKPQKNVTISLPIGYKLR
ncbi:MAG: TonB family protein [Sulfuricurvum sp.]|nr:TonB family protein [Sulfuricurvum sp.]